MTGFDFINPGAGNDTIDMGDIVEGYVGISYRFLDGTGNGITADIDGAANTGSVTSAVGTDTLIDAVNPINSPSVASASAAAMPMMSSPST